MRQATRVVIVSDSSRPPYYQEIQCGRHALVADEPVDRGGLDAGPSPFALLLSSLGACTAIALRRHCERRAWPLERLMVTLELRGAPRSAHIAREIHILGALTDAQCARLAAVCERTPVTLALKGGIRIKTQLLVRPLAL
ncbi:OsmC family protein [Variovorax terrae]|uniref:OsmC family protein n=1 Tax=Variovorax terrae TaxID=2923278 RepID=A0A9X1VVY0_9BURK|nr:OsmC family protein [Variovorax terrae]MCJ0764218.1 OsmC family protein [Variovorax terrae]